MKHVGRYIQADAGSCGNVRSTLRISKDNLVATCSSERPAASNTTGEFLDQRLFNRIRGGIEPDPYLNGKVIGTKIKRIVTNRSDRVIGVIAGHITGQEKRLADQSGVKPATDNIQVTAISRCIIPVPFKLPVTFQAIGKGYGIR